MSTERKFLRFSREAGPLKITEIPEGGFCFSVFLIITNSKNPNEVLLGHINPEAPWDHISAMPDAAIEANKEAWLLPSSHMLYGESPDDAAKRILQEQLSLNDQKLEGPLVFSEVSGPKSHWDLEFIFLSRIEAVRPTQALKELGFLDATKLRKEYIGRNHQDILAHVGKWKEAVNI